VTQYRESDLAFASRLLAREGIWYRFEHGDGGHTLVLADAGAGLAQAAAPVPQRIGGEEGDGVEHVARLASCWGLASGKATERDFHFERPALDLTAAKGQGDLEVYEYPSGHELPADGRRIAGLRLEALQVDAETFEGAGNALAFVPGAKVEIEDGPTVAVVRVSHRAAQGRAPGEHEKGTRYANEFGAIDAARPYRPPRAAPRPRMGIQTATVTGPSGEEVHVDGHGRIKVQMHWDREGQRDDRASCWVRVAQPWAGPGMGASRIPRVGQEVVVRFLEGDPDRPLVTGAVFNGTVPTPVTLPDDKTRSVLRTDSCPGSGGSNELTIEDATGSEEICVHAQKDWNTVVLADRTQGVNHDAALEVAKDRSRTVKGSQRLGVSQTDGAAVGGNVKLTVAGDRTTAVATSHDERVGAVQTVTVGSKRLVSVALASAETIGGAAALTIGGGYAVTVGGALNHAVGGLKNTAVAGAAVEVVGASRQESIGKRRSARTQGDLAIQVKGGVVLAAAQDAEEQVDGKVEIEVKGPLAILCKDGKLEADKIIVVVNGKTALVLQRSGDVKISADAATFKADGEVKVKGAQAKMVSGSSAASGSASVAALQDLDPAKKVVKVTFKDERGEPALAGVKFELKTPAGDKKGAVDGSGVISVGDLKPGTCELELTGLDDD
jgi:type VI secretion system secreted protein VgrG